MKLTHPALSLLAPAILLFPLAPLMAQETKEVAELREPIYRVTKQDNSLTAAATQAVKQSHPLDPAITMAKAALQKCRNEIRDYTAIVVKRERIGTKLGQEQFMLAKIRNEKKSGNKVTQPFSVYLRFLKPAKLKGREVIYVSGQNAGKLIAHEGGWKGRFTPAIHLDPEGTVAMMGQRYPISDIGIQRLCEKLIERAQRDRELGPCELTTQPAKISGRAATQIEVKHPTPMSHLDFHIARVFVDDELGIPIRYEAYDWPAAGQAVSKADLIEEYTYLRLELNPGLTDSDFDPANAAYNMK